MTEKEAQKVLDELNAVRPEMLNDKAKRLFEAIMKIADNRDELQKTVERKDLEITSLEQVHDYDVQMIDDVKGKAVELYDRIEEKDKTIEQQKEQIDYLRRSCDRKEECLIEEQQENAELENELKQKDKQIEQYQNMLATNDMLHVIECENKDKIIDLMAEMINNYDIDEDICEQMGQNKNCNEFEDKEKCKICIKQYFKNKVKEV